MIFVRHSLAALASACLFTACGGGETDTSAPPSTTSATSAATVRLEGCVQGAPATVQALGDDGRLLATATADTQGVFVLQVPPRQNLRLRLATGGDADLELLTGSTSLSLTGCLNASA